MNYLLKTRKRGLSSTTFKNVLKDGAGFTLIELILYVAILTIVLSALVPFAWNAVETGVKSAVQQEVNANARYVSERIKYEIRNANSITSINNTSCVNNSIEINTATNPVTVIDVFNGKIRIKYGALGTPVNLNSNNTNVSCLTFTDFRSADFKTEHIQFTINIAAKFGAVRQEYQDSVVVESSAEVRSNPL